MHGFDQRGHCRFGQLFSQANKGEGGFFIHPPAEDAGIGKQEFSPGGLTEFMVEEHGFGEERIGTVIRRLRKGKEEFRQKGLGSFM